VVVYDERVIGRSRTGLLATAVLVVAACTTGGPTITEPTPRPVVTEPLYTAAPTDEPTEAPTLEPTAAGDLPLSPGWEWPAEATLVMSGTTGYRDGSFSESGIAKYCGNVAYNMTMNERGFGLYLWNDKSGDQIRIINFGTEDLVPGSTSTVFDIEVGGHLDVLSAQATVVIHAGQTDIAESGTGTAQLTVDGSTRTVDIDATDEDGANVKVHAICTDPGT
jgi:hypothetical protein